MRTHHQGKLMRTGIVKQKGFTLIEAIITLAIATILAAMATPSFINLLNKRRISASANTIYSTLQEARSLAITEGTSVSGCLSNDGLSCLKIVNRGSAAQFISFRGTIEPTTITWSALGIRATPLNTHAGKISLGKFGGPSKIIQFQSDGITLGSSQNGTFTLSGTSSAMDKKVVVARTGRVTIK